ncbi:MAG: PEP-CTERM sorting domain-containing protein [Terriglobia bacterium]
MKRSLTLSILCSLALACLACPSFATKVTVKLTGVNGAVQGGVYVDPYSGTINGVPAPLVCDDFSHETYFNETWQANVSTFADLSDVRFQQGTPAATLLAYDEAAYLYGQLGAHPSDIGDISFALWALFTPSAKLSSGFTTGASNWLSTAQGQTYYAGEFSNFEILTPVISGSNSPQEFLTTTPEPASIMLFGTGLLALALALRKRVMA